MMRGVRGATTVLENTEQAIVEATKELVEEMASHNRINAEDVSHVFISATHDLDASFPAKALRQISGWVYVPVMCMRELDVQGSLDHCIRVMMVAETKLTQQDVHHIYHHRAKQLRPDLVEKTGVDEEHVR